MQLYTPLHTKYIPLIERINDPDCINLKEASFVNSSLAKVISLMVKVIQTRTGKPLKGSLDVAFTVKKSSGIYSGVKFYIGSTGNALRFNWVINKSSTLNSIDFFEKKKLGPVKTLNVEAMNVNQTIEAISEYIKTGKDLINVELEESVLKESKMLEFGIGSVIAKFQKAEEEVPIISKENERVVVKIKALTGEQIFEKIERDLEYFLSGQSGKQAFIVAGTSGIGKTFTVRKMLQSVAGAAKQPPLRILPPIGSKRMKDLLAAEGDEGSDGKKIAKSVQAKMRELSRVQIPFKAEWVQGGQDVKGVELFVELFQSNGKVLLYDDADTVFTIKENKLLLKQALDSQPARTIKWGTKVPYVDLGAKVGIMPNEFIYTGKLIIITNLTSGQIDSAIKSRARLIDVDLSPVQFMDRLKSLLPEIQKNENPAIGMNYYEEAFDWLYDMFINKKVIDKFDIRTFVDGLVTELYILKGDKSLWNTIAAINIKAVYPGAKFQIG